MGIQLPEDARPEAAAGRPSEHVAVVVIDAPAVANALSGRFFGSCSSKPTCRSRRRCGGRS